MTIQSFDVPVGRRLYLSSLVAQVCPEFRATCIWRGLGT
jgi:hypothetical protein